MTANCSMTACTAQPRGGDDDDDVTTSARTETSVVSEYCGAGRVDLFALADQPVPQLVLERRLLREACKHTQPASDDVRTTHDSESNSTVVI